MQREDSTTEQELQPTASLKHSSKPVAAFPPHPAILRERQLRQSNHRRQQQHKNARSFDSGLRTPRTKSNLGGPPYPALKKARWNPPALSTTILKLLRSST